MKILLAVICSAVLVVTACRNTTASSNASPALTVFAAASLTEAFQDVKTEQHQDITYNFGGSGSLVTQVKQGAPADVIATADTASMQQLVDANLVETSVVFAKNKLQILVAPDNPKNIKSLGDLANTSVKTVLCDSTVPAGKYAAQVLHNAGVTVKAVSNEVNVKAAVAKVASNEADAAIVYQTDVMAAAKGEGIEIPDTINVITEYPVAVVKSSNHRDTAVAFVNYLVGNDSQDVLKRHGFISAH